MLSINVINLLILFFIILIFSQIFLAFFNNIIIEGLTNGATTSSDQYQPYNMNDPNNAMILAQQNAGNIQVLKQQIDDLSGLNKEVQDISGNVATLQTQVTGLISAQTQYAQNMAPKTTPKISGT